MRQGLAEAELHTQVGFPTLMPTRFLPVLVTCSSLGQRPTTCPRRLPGSQGPHLAELDVLLVEDAVLDGGLQRLHGRGRAPGPPLRGPEETDDGQEGNSSHFPFWPLPPPSVQRGSCKAWGRGALPTVKEIEWFGEGIPHFSPGVPGTPLEPGRGLRPPEGR